MNRINILLIAEKILNKRNRNLDSYRVNENTSPENNNFSETPHNTFADDTEPIFPVTSQTPSKTRERSTSINRIPDFTIGFASPDGQSSNIDTIYEKIKIQNLRENIIEIFDTELVNFKAQCEDLVKNSCVDYNKIIGQLQDGLKSKDHIINKLLTTIGDLTSSELKSKGNIMHKLINCEENTNRTTINQSSTKIISDNIQSVNDSDKNNNINPIKEQVELQQLKRTVRP